MPGSLLRSIPLQNSSAGSGTASDLRNLSRIRRPGRTSPASAALPKNVLLFSKTKGFRYSSIPAGIAAIEQLGSVNGIGVTATEDAASFTPAILSRYQAVIFLSTTGDLLNDTQQVAFETYLASGGGFVGIHSASDTEYDWPWYGGLVGTYLAGHPPVQVAVLNVEDRANEATSHLSATWDRLAQRPPAQLH